MKHLCDRHTSSWPPLLYLSSLVTILFLMSHIASFVQLTSAEDLPAVAVPVLLPTALLKAQTLAFTYHIYLCQCTCIAS